MIFGIAKASRLDHSLSGNDHRTGAGPTVDLHVSVDRLQPNPALLRDGDLEGERLSGSKLPRAAVNANVLFGGIAADDEE